MREVTLTLPYAALASDNLRKGLAKEAWKKYKTGREASHMIAMTQVKDRPAFATEKVEMHLLFWLPDARRRDPNNLLKMICDALAGVVYRDDDQIRSLSWLVQDIDEDNPRVEITVRERLQ